MTYGAVRIRALFGVLILLTTACASQTGSETKVSSSSDLEPVRVEDLPDPEEAARVYADCLRDKGWNARVEDGGVFVEHAAAQAPAVDEATEECQQQLIEAGIVPHPDRPPSEELIRKVYGENRALHECLKLNGFPVTNVPSWENFRDTRLHGEIDERWSPMAKIYESGDVELLHDAAEKCGEEQ